MRSDNALEPPRERSADRYTKTAIAANAASKSSAALALGDETFIGEAAANFVRLDHQGKDDRRHRDIQRQDGPMRAEARAGVIVATSARRLARSEQD